MVSLIKIGNSQGVIISERLIEQANLEGKELVLEVCNGGVFVSSKQQRKPREGWAASIEEILASKGVEHTDVERLNSELMLEK